MSGDNTPSAAGDVECPTCGAWVGWACEGPDYGYHAAGYHPSRQRTADRDAAAKEIDLSTETKERHEHDRSGVSTVMTREDSIRTKTWVTEDGRYLTVDAIDGDHLRAIQRMLLSDIAPGYDQAAGREIVRDFMAKRENLLDYTVDIDRDAYAAAWLQIIDDEFARRQATR